MEKFTIGEPWETDADGNLLAITNRGGYDVCYMNLYLTKGRQIAYASHIVDCVNGCAGIENPLAVGEMVEALKKVEEMAGTLMDEVVGNKATNWGIINDGLVKINRALKNVKGPNP